MKKIAILALHLGYGGIEKSIATLANMLVKNYEVEIVSTYKLYEKPVFDISEDVKIKYLITNYKPNQREFKAALKKKKFITAFKEGFLGFRKLRERRKRNINYIVHSDADIIISTKDIFDRWLGEYGSDDIVKIGWEHNHYHDDMKFAMNITKSCWRLDYLVLVSASLKRFYSKQLRKSKCKCVFIPNALDNIPTKLSPLKENRIISVGRLSSEKGVHGFIKNILSNF